MQSVIEDQD